MKNFGKSSRVHSQGVQKIFMAPIYGTHCAVIFATAQLSCLPCSLLAKSEITPSLISTCDQHVGLVYSRLHFSNEG